MAVKILGLHASGPNTAACIVVNGNLLAFAEEERFTRVKLASNTVPINATKFCLKQSKLTLSDIDIVSFGWDNKKYPIKMSKFYSKRMSHPKKDQFSFAYEEISLKEKTPQIFEKKIMNSFRRAGFHETFPEIVYNEHHLCHAASVFYPSPYKKALIFVLDLQVKNLHRLFGWAHPVICN